MYKIRIIKDEGFRQELNEFFDRILIVIRCNDSEVNISVFRDDLINCYILNNDNLNLLLDSFCYENKIKKIDILRDLNKFFEKHGRIFYE